MFTHSTTQRRAAVCQSGRIAAVLSAGARGGRQGRGVDRPAPATTRCHRLGVSRSPPQRASRESGCRSDRL